MNAMTRPDAIRDALIRDMRQAPALRTNWRENASHAFSGAFAARFAPLDAAGCHGGLTTHSKVAQMAVVLSHISGLNVETKLKNVL